MPRIIAVDIIMDIIPFECLLGLRFPLIGEIHQKRRDLMTNKSKSEFSVLLLNAEIVSNKMTKNVCLTK